MVPEQENAIVHSTLSCCTGRRLQRVLRRVYTVPVVPRLIIRSIVGVSLDVAAVVSIPILWASLTNSTAPYEK